MPPSITDFTLGYHDNAKWPQPWPFIAERWARVHWKCWKLAWATFKFIQRSTLNCVAFVEKQLCMLQHNDSKLMLLFPFQCHLQMTYDDFYFSLFWTLLRINILWLNRGSACIFTDHNRPYGHAANLSKQMKIIVSLALREHWPDVCSASVVRPPWNETLN